ncbi:carbamate kinase [Carbonactinospora thermoautotrophica]|uniref:carbamate kinase n=1 Tax=Carbonactinospora thermoautotrophica TaxID=1469144 RepID=UPI0022716543|nr:carbamate kinase [Carbonactinospora thermoautotrophica]MCX9192942.1 carbamate kinase [Carbonactinospora thermoautotrophica]
MRVLIALGGNAMTGPDGSATVAAQQEAIGRAMEHVADLVAYGVDVVLTHGNGPQVGNLLVKNELAAPVVPPVPLDWCDAQTQATIGYMILNALDAALAARGVDRRAAILVTRTRVDADDPAFAEPTKPIGRHLPREEAELMIAHGQAWKDMGARGWRRVVASPEPREIVDAPAVARLVRDGFIVVAAGGGGIPVVRGRDGRLRGVEAVVDKDLSAALLARQVHADLLVIATDVEHVYVDHGTPRARPLGRVTAQELRKHVDQGQFPAGSMGPKVEAALRFVETGGRRAVITALDRIEQAVTGAGGEPVGTVVENRA